MVKVNIDTDKISNSLVSLAQNEKSYLKSARSRANAVNMPNGEFGWSNITAKIGDCEDKAKRYLSWVNDIKNSFNDGIMNNVDNINKISVENVTLRQINVK